ncbi:dihydroxyacetone kinase [Pilobolus umbonatus]|nr:dihydroxyacetone kinase [Pilobolus umbonatus]
MSEVKHIINTPDTLVSENIRGLCYVNSNLRVMEREKVIYHASMDTIAANQVTIISGGGSGHEPAYAGMVGEGMLAAAISGHVFASPSSSQVLAAIEKAQSRHGTLVLIMNYTGDCLNFGLAVERAKAKGIKVDLIAIGDDVAVGREKGGKVGRRGMAATLLAIKLAGAVAANGGSLEEVQAMAQYVNDHSATLGMAFDHCHVPGSTSYSQLNADELELGMGIHNETGFLKTKMMSANDLVNKMMNTMVDQQDKDRQYISLPDNKQTSVVLLVNNLGGISIIEQNLVVKEAVDFILSRDHMKLERVIAGSFVTSLNMPGFSLSLLTLEEDRKKELLSHLDADVNVAGWPSCIKPFHENIVDQSSAKTSLSSGSTNNDKGKVNNPKLVEASIRGALKALIAKEPEITHYDTLLGDGDCGTTLKTAACAILDALPSYDLTSAPKTILGIADTIEQSVGGTSSAIYCIYLNALAHGLLKSDKSTVNTHDWIQACDYALSRLMTYTKARVGDRTLMDSLCPFVESLNKNGDLVEACKASEEGTERTRKLSAKMGRSSYLSNEEVLEKGIPDAGAYGLSILIEGLTNAIKSYQ